MTSLDERLDKIERRWRDFVIATSIIGGCLVAFLGFTYMTIPQRIEAALEANIVKQSEAQAEASAEAAEEARKRAEKVDGELSKFYADWVESGRLIDDAKAEIEPLRTEYEDELNEVTGLINWRDRVRRNSSASVRDRTVETGGIDGWDENALCPPGHYVCGVIPGIGRIWTQGGNVSVLKGIKVRCCRF